MLAANYFRAGMETISDELLASLVRSFVKIWLVNTADINNAMTMP